jgi:hypothetical protein
METKKKGYKEVFNTPEGYFERLAKDISAATVENNTVAPKRHIVIGKWYRVAGYAAALAIMFATGVGANGNISIGVGTVGGMLIGTIALLFVVPVLFIIFRNIEEKVMPQRNKEIES